MKKNKGFTLIELLAIIVILAIIAVITVPIILNIIENSRKGATIDSAYGYRDSVQQYYLTKSVTDSSQQSPSGVKYVSEIKSDGLTISGQEPTDGWVKLDKGQVVDYSLKFGDYVISLNTTTNTPESTKNGIIKDAPGTIPSCPGCVFAWYTNETKYGSDNVGDILVNGSKNYNDIIKSSGKDYFLGHILNEQGKILRAFACGIHIDGTPFCIEGTVDGSKNEENIELLNDIFGTYNSNTKLGCENHGSTFDCSDSKSWSIYSNSCGAVKVSGCYTTCTTNVPGTLVCY